jgi:hypothetical protein
MLTLRLKSFKRKKFELINSRTNNNLITLLVVNLFIGSLNQIWMIFIAKVYLYIFSFGFLLEILFHIMQNKVTAINITNTFILNILGNYSIFDPFVKN